MKAAAFFLKLLFSALLLTTLVLLVFEVAQVRRSTTQPVYTHPNATAPSVYNYVRYART